MRKVFLSSTTSDLKDYREAVSRTIRGLDGWACEQMEYFGARDARVPDLCRDRVKACDLVVGLLGPLYGSQMGKRKDISYISYTEFEYDIATSLKKPRLIFLSDDDHFALPEKIRASENDAKRKRQQAFRKKVTEVDGRVVDFFSKPEELAGKVLRAITNWEREILAPRAGSNHGEMVAECCDRPAQVGQFEEFFQSHARQRGGPPRICIIHGEDGECHGSLARRLTTHIYRVGQGDPQAAAPEPVLIPWQVGIPHMITRLFEKFQQQPHHPPDTHPSARRVAGPLLELADAATEGEAFGELLSRSGYRFVVIQHLVRLGRWEVSIGSELESYLRFWANVALHNTGPLVFVFLWVVYPRGPWTMPWWNVWLRLAASYRGLRKRRIQRGLDRAERDATKTHGVPISRLPELEPVTHDDVRLWFDEHQIYESERRRIEAAEAIVRPGQRMKMAHVEDKLREHHRQFVQQRDE